MFLEREVELLPEDDREHFPYAHAPHFALGQKAYLDITNPWLHEQVYLHLLGEALPCGTSSDPASFVKESRRWANTFKNHWGLDRYEIARMYSSYKATLAGFGCEALRHEDIDVAIPALAVCGLINNKLVQRRIGEIIAEGGFSCSVKVMKLLRDANSKFTSLRA